MLKKLSVWCLLLLYFGTANGMAVNLHYCGKRFAKVQVNAAKIKSCCDVKDEANDKCCHNRQLNIKIDDGHRNVASVDLPKIQTFELFALNEKPNSAGNHFLLATYPKVILNNPPPLAVPLSIQYCVFRI